MLSIVFAVHHFPPRYTGGAEWRTFRTAAALQQRGHTVQVVAVERTDAGAVDSARRTGGRRTGGRENGKTGGVVFVDDDYEDIPVRRLSFDQTAVPDPFRWSYDNPWIGDAVACLLQERSPELFHLVSGYLISASALRAAQRLGIPSVVSLTDFWFLCPRVTMLRSDGTLSELPVRAETCARCLGEEQRRFRLPAQVAGRTVLGSKLVDLYWRRQTGAIRRVEERMEFLGETLNAAGAILSPSQFLRQAFIAAGIDPRRMVFSRQGRDFPHLRAELPEKEPSPRLRVGYLGQLASIKGVQVLFDAVRRLPGRTMTVQAYGDVGLFPKNVARLRRMAAKDERLQLAGAFRGEALSEVLRRLDVIVVPSLWYENSPNVILEAFAHRTPVIASDLGGMAELVHHGENGLLFRPGDAQDLARQLERLLDEPDLLPRLQSGIEPVRSVAEEIDELEEIYAAVVRGELPTDRRSHGHG